jgi:hypothetical protein
MTHFCTDRTAKRPLISRIREIQVKVYLPQKKNFNKFCLFFLPKNRTLLLRLVPYVVAPGDVGQEFLVESYVFFAYSFPYANGVDLVAPRWAPEVRARAKHVCLL